MKSLLSDRNYFSSYILIITATAILLIISITDRRDITSATIIISAMILFLTGIFLFTFAKRGSMDNHIISLIPVQNQINICRIAADLGIMGNAWFLPPDRSGESCIMQFIPVTSYKGGFLKGNTFTSGQGGTGVLIPPTGKMLMDDLRKNSNLVLPNSIDEILILLKETGEDLLEISENVRVQKTGNGISIILDNYLLIEGCRIVSAESSACCSMNPCPVCSLFGMIITEGLNQAIMIERCRPDKKTSRVEIFFSFFSTVTQ